jgi:DNA ligase (NAD+)
MKELFNDDMPFVGQEVKVFKANMIIPQIASAQKIDPEFNHYIDLPFIEIPEVCPVCGSTTTIRENNDSQFLYCTSPTCPGKLINRLDHFCGKKGLDIKGLSKATLTKLIDWGWVENINDLPKLVEHKAEWVKKPGFGEKSVQNILTAIEMAIANIDFIKFISALGIPLVGMTVAKEIAKHENSYTSFREDVKNRIAFSDWNGFGPEIEKALWNYDYTDADIFYSNCNVQEVETEEESAAEPQIFADKTFVITGKLNGFKNRNELKEILESYGAKVTDSVTKKTSYLINNDLESANSKNVAGKRLGIPIITEAELFAMMDELKK